MAKEQSWYPLLKSYPFSEKINAVSLGAEVLFVRLIAQADDYGNYWGDPRMILATLFPHRWARRTVSETDAGRWRDELVTCPVGPLAALYSVSGIEYIHIIAAQRRLRGDVLPKLRFPREPSNIEEEATSAHVTDAGRTRAGRGPLEQEQEQELEQELEEAAAEKRGGGHPPSSDVSRGHPRASAVTEEADSLSDTHAIPIGKASAKPSAKPIEAHPEDEVIDYLNQVARTKFRHSEASRKNIAARLAESATVDDCRAVIDHKAAQWIGNPEMEQYLNPTVLFRPQKFENNLVAAVRWIEQGRPAIGPNGKKDCVQESLDNIAAWLSRGEGEHGEQESGGDGYGNAGDGVGAEGDGAGDGGMVVDPLAIV